MPEKVILVPVSDAMKDFRDAQTRLNSLLRSTEICYGHMLGSKLPSSADFWSIFSHAQSHAWFPNKEGATKYNKSVPAFLKDVELNLASLHRNVLINFYSYFEALLDARFQKRFFNTNFLTSCGAFAWPNRDYAPQAKTVMLADLSRLIRNRIIHAGDHLPRAKDDKVVIEMSKAVLPKDGIEGRQTRVAMNFYKLDEAAILACFNEFVSGVDQKCKTAAKKQNLGTHEFFYTLFTFTHLDNLAFEIEEALFDPGVLGESPALIKRAANRVRNDAMCAWTQGA
jgi:hypothetical protein